MLPEWAGLVEDIFSESAVNMAILARSKHFAAQQLLASGQVLEAMPGDFSVTHLVAKLLDYGMTSGRRLRDPIVLHRVAGIPEAHAQPSCGRACP